MKLSSTGAQQSPAASAAPLYAGPADVACDFCTGARRRKALMSCLVCLASCCETHLQPHYNVPVLKKHKLVPATDKLQEKMCSSHNKLMEVFCRTDQQSICYLCTMDEHKGHDIVSAAAEKAEKQKQLVTSQEEVQQKIQEKEKELKDLRKVLEDLNQRSAEAAVEASDRIFSEMMVSIERRRGELKELIRDQQQNAVAQTEALLRQLEQTLEQLERRHADLEELSNTEDNITFIQSFQSLSSSTGSPVSPSVLICPLRSFTDVTDVVSGLRDQLDDILKTTWPQIERVCAVDVLHPAEPQTRKDFLQYSSPLSLDINTIHKQLSLSEEKRKVTFTKQQQPYPDHVERFTVYCQVLCTEGLSERRYWEVERSGGEARIAVCYKDTDRGTYFGNNDKSWSLQCTDKDYTFIHNSVQTKVSVPVSSRVGVYLDHKAGTLSFYSVSDTMTLLHTVQTTFTQPLYPGICVWGNWGDTVELCKTW